jgi:ribosomal-protein-alanine N-acetyltransferase
MRKWFLLILGVIVIAINSWRIYDMFQPKVGPIGNGDIGNHVWISFITGFIVGFWAIAQFFILLVFEKKKESVRDGYFK